MAQRAAYDVDDALGLNLERAREDLAPRAERQLDGVRSASAASWTRSSLTAPAAARQGGERGLGSLLGRGDSGCAPLGLTGDASLVADLVGLGADGRQHVGDLLARSPGARASSCSNA